MRPGFLERWFLKHLSTTDSFNQFRAVIAFCPCGYYKYLRLKEAALAFVQTKIAPKSFAAAVVPSERPVWVVDGECCQ